MGANVTAAGAGGLTLSGYTFSHWNTLANDSGASVSPGGTFVMGVQNVTLYAQYSVNSYTVTYSNYLYTSGTAPSPVTAAYNNDITVSTNSGNLLRINSGGVSYKMTGWNTDPAGTGTPYAFSSTLTIPAGNITLYPVWEPYAVNDTGPAGGKIFYVASDYSAGWRYMEAANSSSSVNYAFTPSGVTLTSRDTETGIGTGLENTNKIFTNEPYFSAAWYCDAYIDGDFDDWFLPSLDELCEIRNVVDFGTTAHWSSSEFSYANAYWVNQTNTGNNSKNMKFYVRPARRF